MTVAEQLRAARALIADPAHWTRYEYARDAEGNGVSYTDERATCFCAEGAIYRIARGVLAMGLDPLTRAARRLYGVNAVIVNDNWGHEHVLACFDAAIADVEGR